MVLAATATVTLPLGWMYSLFEEFSCKAKIVCTLQSRRLNLYSVSVSDMDFASSLRTLKKTAAIKAIKAV